MAMEFAKNLERNHMEVRGLKLEVTEEVITKVIGLPVEGKRWFTRKVNDPSLKGDFLQESESLVKKGRGIDRLSLPQTWVDVSLFLIMYITCEGRATIVFIYHFSFFNHRYHQ